MDETATGEIIDFEPNLLRWWIRMYLLEMFSEALSKVETDAIDGFSY